MNILSNPRPEAEWIDDEMMPEIGLMDDELFLDELDGEDESLEVQDDIQHKIPMWRLIEMSREDRTLKWDLADFEDYDKFEDYAT